MAIIQNKFSKVIVEHPIIKTIVFGCSVVLSGILTSAFVNDISYPDGLHWREFYLKGTFWWIVLYLILVGLYNYYLYRLDVSVEKFMDNEYSRAYIFSACIPEFVDKCKEEISQGTGIEGAKRLIDFLKTM